ncbi:MAG: hypothetical protein A2096_09490 [Spirochaetes bacterium GWF1_41_5]|nr:MAG: hypothetical protein A2096_09490 [Spirochaetes bacterium GWF1_41_5]
MHLLFSDIHANYEALAIILAAAGREGITSLIHAGDILDYSFQHHEVIREFVSRNIASVQGNHDQMVSGLEQYFRDDKELDEEEVRYLTGLPQALVFDNIAVTHDLPPDAGRTPETIQQMTAGKYSADAIRFYFCGHLHNFEIVEIPSGIPVLPEAEEPLIKKPIMPLSKQPGTLECFRLQPDQRYLIRLPAAYQYDPPHKQWLTQYVTFSEKVLMLQLHTQKFDNTAMLEHLGVMS